MRRRPLITLDQLHTFLVVAEREHVTAAAEGLGRSQGTVSASVLRLEDALGVPLLQRVGRNVRLTDVGRAVRQLALRALDAAAQIEELTTGYLAFERGAVRVVAGPLIGASHLARWLAPFVRDHPEIDLHLTFAGEDEAIDAVEHGDSDVAVVPAGTRRPRVESTVIEATELAIVVAAQHPLATQREPFAALREHRFLVPEGGSATQLRAARAGGRRPDEGPMVQLDEEALMAALLAGMGFAALPRASIDAELKAGTLVALPRRGRPVMQRFSAARREALHTPAVQAFWEDLKRQAAAAEARKPPA